jgi:hypothetical protein
MLTMIVLSVLTWCLVCQFEAGLNLMLGHQLAPAALVPRCSRAGGGT